MTDVSGNPDRAEQWLTVKEFAAHLRVSRMTIYRMVEAGDLRSVRVGRSIRIAGSEMRRLTHANED